MDESQEIDAACKLFFEYANTLNQEFLDDESTAHMQEKCLAIGEELAQLGFWILARSMQLLEANQLPDGAMQSVITLKHDMILVRKDAPAYKPLAKASPVSKVFGKPTAPQLPAKRAITKPTLTCACAIFLRFCAVLCSILGPSLPVRGRPIALFRRLACKPSFTSPVGFFSEV